MSKQFLQNIWKMTGSFVQ